MIKKWLIKNNNQEVSLKSFYNNTKEFVDKVVINYNLDNNNYVGINLIEKDYNQKGNSMTLEKLATMFIEFKDDINNKFNDFKEDINNKFDDLNDKVDNGFKEVNSRIDKLEKDVSLIMSCPTIKKEISEMQK